MSDVLQEFMVCEMGFTKQFAVLSAKLCVGQAFEGMHFQPYVMRKLS